MAPLAQLNLKLPAEVADSWRAQAAAQGLSVRDWLLAQLEAPTAPAAGPAGGDGLADRLAQLEARTAELGEAVAQLEAQGPAHRSPYRVAPSIARTGGGLSPDQGSPIPPAGELPSPDGGITTAELADRTGTNRAAWNTWASKAAPGAVRSHPQAGPWRLVGKCPAPNGGPARWLWAPAEG
jgi:hypothetical protein